MDKLLCKLAGGGMVVVKPDGEIHITIKTNIGYDATCVIDENLLNVLAREWMDRNDIAYHSVTIGDEHE